MTPAVPHPPDPNQRACAYIMELMLFLAAAFLAWANGANDNPKGVATLIGSGTARFRPALTWATATTFAGSLAALVLGRALMATFSGKGLVPDQVTVDPVFLGSVGLAAAITVAAASRIGMPISTTHALTGALVGVGWVWVGSELAISHLGKVFFLPLAVSPLLALGTTIPVYWSARALRLKLGVEEDSCVCVSTQSPALAATSTGSFQTVTVTIGPEVTLHTGSSATCSAGYRGSVLGFDAQWLLDRAHFLSSGAVGFARGLNDAPKITALLLAAQGVSAIGGFGVVAVAMAAGGWFGSRRVAKTVSHEITEMNAGQGFAANMVTALLVSSASWIGVPVSTTHVSVGALFGIGAVNGTARWKKIGTIVSAWLLTLPFAAIAGVVVAKAMGAWIG